MFMLIFIFAFMKGSTLWVVGNVSELEPIPTLGPGDEFVFMFMFMFIFMSIIFICKFCQVYNFLMYVSCMYSMTILI